MPFFPFYMVRFAALLVLAFLLGGCGLMAKDTDQGAAAADSASHSEAVWDADPVPYDVSFRVESGPEDLAAKMKDLSQLAELRKEPPDSLLALERRARQDQQTAVKLMNSECYYDAKADVDLDDTVKPVHVIITLKPGPRFNVGSADVIYEPEPDVPAALLNRRRVVGFWGLETEKLPAPEFPSTIPGITIGEPVTAKAMLDAVEKIPHELRDRGYPLAKITDSIYTLNKPERLLNARILIDTGPPALMGEALIKGEGDVNVSYLKRLVPWEPGKEPWDNALVQDYANTLRSTGLFRQVEVKLDEKKLDKTRGTPVLPIDVELSEGTQHTIAASARYDSDTGFGVEGHWEHRNLFHNGEKLSVDVPISQEEMGIKLRFDKPAVFGRDQRLWLEAQALRESTDSYQSSYIKLEPGIYSRMSRQWSGAASFLMESGYLKDNDHDEQPYAVFSPRAGIRYDGRNNRANPTKGTLLELKLKPFSGYYDEPFSAFAGSVSAAAWYAPLGRRPDGQTDDTLVLAGRIEEGAMPWSSSLYSIPSSLRYYTGGAGSVRGYAYQSIGPRDSEGDPLGGRSYQVVNLEARFMVAENIGIVPFLDGGMVYEEEFPEIFGEMDWGVGLGFRYYTPIGPVRFDVATPLHRIDDDPPVQFYISIGQSF